MPIQQMLLGVGAVATKTYVDDVFSTYVYKGDGNSSRNITNNIDLLTEGGLVWYKSRSAGKGHRLVDTERGVTKVIESNDSNAEAVEATGLKAFLTNGFTVGSDDTINESGGDQASWSFRKAPGFFTIKEYSGTGSVQSISHDLGSKPGMILIKRTDTSADWVVYHRSMDVMAEDYYGPGNSQERGYLKLNETNAIAYTSRLGLRPSQDPTATTFHVKNQSNVNASGGTYIAYIFGGGEDQTTATARSLTFDGSYDSLQLASSSDFNFGTGDFTFEGWLKPNNNTDFQVFLNWGSDNPSIGISNDNNSFIYYNSTVNSKTAGIAAVGQWTHYAISRSSGTTRLFLNGDLKNSFSDSHNYGAQALSIGAYINGNNSWNGSISNVRIVKGTAVYTSSFRPPTEPLTNITNTVLLCCNNSSPTGSTVTPGTITAENNVTASTDSPFDDPAGFVFGDAGDQNAIKCSSYVGSGSAGLEVNLGWEPQLIIFKNASASYNWYVLDVMRGIVSGGDDAILAANDSGAEWDSSYIDVTSTGFKLQTSHALGNGSGNTYVYMCVRRPDGYVGKPPELGTGVFAMDTGNNSFPAMDTGFPVDFGLAKKPATTDNWRTGGRLTGTKALYTNATDAQSNHVNQVWDSNVGFWKSIDSSFQAWAWKRHAGFDVVTASSLPDGATLSHQLGKTPEMIWGKIRDNTGAWSVYHKNLNGGTNPEQYRLQLSSDAAEATNTGAWNNTAPSATHFTVGANFTGSHDPIFMLFSSVDGISKVGSYTGNGTGASSTQTITLGFQPRFLIIKKADGTNHWVVFDTVRGWNGSDYVLELNESGAQTDGYGNVIDPTSTGFTVRNNYGMINTNNSNYIYYAHS